MTLALLITAVGGAWADEVITVTWSSGDNYENNNSKDGVTLSGETIYYDGEEWVLAYDESMGTFTTELGNFTKIEITGGYINGFSGEGWSGRTWTGNAAAVPFGGYITDDSGEKPWTITFTIEPASSEPAEPAIEVTTNKAENDTVFTEAWFNMPAFDATAEYELVRDMSIQMTATMGDGTDGVRYRVKKAQQGEGYEPADLNMMQVLALVAVNDGIEQKALTQDQDYYCRIYKLDEQTLQPIGDGVTLYDFDFAPGLYALKAFAQDDSDYAGETAFSNTFKLFQGYEVEIAAGEYVTYYKEENLYVEDEDAELYTITSVGSETATAAPLTVAKAYTPILVKNKGAEKKMILLIPTETEGDNVTAAPEFIGTLEATTIAASSENQNNYAFNGLQFVWVKNAIAVGANKAWLTINTGVPSARGITLVFDDETTKIANTNITNITNGDWYDLNGRKLDKMPTKKGVYLFNGRKVVVK